MTALRACQYAIMVAGALVVLMALFIPGAGPQTEKMVTWIAGVCFAVIAAGLVGLLWVVL